VRQLGPEVVVRFVVSEPRGDKPAQEPVRAELIRVSYQTSTPPPADPDAFRRRGDIVGLLEGDPLAAGEYAAIVDSTVLQLADGGVGWTLRYGVRVRDRRGRSSPLVIGVDMLPVKPIEPPVDLTGEPTADGVRLAWSPPAGVTDAEFNIYRTTPGGPEAQKPLNDEPLVEGEYLDTDAVMGRTYVYLVRAALADETPYRESLSSEPREIVAEDRFEPEAPDGLVAVQEGRAVRLFWNPNDERDLAGYNIYKRVDEGSWERAVEGWLQSTYLDPGIGAGQQLAYRVTAIDRADPPNESSPSDTVELLTVEEPQNPGSPR
jgi:hypothetical protein